MTRPRFTLGSFIASIFKPSKNPTPTGVRHRKVTSTKNRETSRVRSYNKLTAANQRILDETGNRDAYLRGEISIADARRELRQHAVTAGFVKPTGGRRPMLIIAKGQGPMFVTPLNDREASRAGKYGNAVNNTLHGRMTGHQLADFRGLTIGGHQLETDEYDVIDYWENGELDFDDIYAETE